ncbi:MAG: serine protease, partial [Gammaproteobacteria bacterium]
TTPHQDHAVNNDQMPYNDCTCHIHNHPLMLKRSLILTCWLLLICKQPLAQEAISLFNEYSGRIYQIRIIEESTGKQAALGSGFQISHDGTIVTNYHVISEYTSHPDRYRIEYVAHDGRRGELELLDIDVINDLSLLKRDDYSGQYLEIAEELPVQGQSIYSLGNPHDLGLTVVPGTYNGIAAYSLYKRIHFSGSINPGMSGGPVLNSSGQVIGVNVATAGNQISFLVPLEYLVALIKRPRSGPVSLDNIKTVISSQLERNQQKIFAELLNKEWVTSSFRGVQVPNEIAEYIRCWGASDNNPEVYYQGYMSLCSQDEQIFLSSSFTTGQIVYQFNWVESDQLNVFQFYNMYQAQIENVYPDNPARREDVSNFECHEDFFRDGEPDSSTVNKGTFCARKYLEYPGLYDVLYIGATVHEKDKGLVSHFTLAGVSMESALQFTQKFLGSIRWN